MAPRTKVFLGITVALLIGLVYVRSASNLFSPVSGYVVKERASRFHRGDEYRQTRIMLLRNIDIISVVDLLKPRLEARGFTTTMVGPHRADGANFSQAPQDPKGWTVIVRNGKDQRLDGILIMESRPLEGLEAVWARLAGVQEASTSIWRRGPRGDPTDIFGDPITPAPAPIKIVP